MSEEYAKGYRQGFLDGFNQRTQQPAPPGQWPGTAPNICHKCGMNWSGAMGYVCPRQDCQIQPKIIAATSNNEWLGNDPEWQKDHDRSKY